MSLSEGPAIRRTSSNPEGYQRRSSIAEGAFSPMISSPLASSYNAGASSPLSNSSCVDMFQLVPSSPTHPSLLPFADLAESEPDIRSCDEEMMKMDDESDAFPMASSPRIGQFDAAPSSSPGPSWLPALAANRHDRLFSISQPSRPGSRPWKQPGSSRASSRSSASGTPLSSPTPLSRAYTSKAGQSDRSPSQLRLQAANRLRTIERKNRSNAHRPLLDAFSVGSHRGIDEIISRKEDMMTAELGRRHIKQLNREWEDLLSSQAYATDEMIEEAEESDSVEEPPDFSHEVLCSDAMDSEDPDTSLVSACSTIRPAEHPYSLLAILLAPPAVCPACPVGTIQASEPTPQGVRCGHCNWTVDGATLASIDQHFVEHICSEGASHQPSLGYNPHVGTNFSCSHPECDEMIFV